ncbi:MAG: hypothetical protein J7J17_00995 [Hadesarchaea archaeon]|nr:hypothetical protein [Hadesarchaea archaeon]
MSKKYLTCPECCCVDLQKVRKNKWKCETCGTTFDFERLRRVPDLLVGRQFQEDFIDEFLGGAKLEHCPELGERAWEWQGKHGTLYTLDVGNGWHMVMWTKGNNRESGSEPGD